MCGISALYRFTNMSRQDKDNLVRMNRDMHYRGPDGEGYWSDDTCAMAQTRLSIIGLENGAQPLFNADKSLVLICNGEIYNYKELRQHVAEHGYTCATDTDCEVILYLYELYGEECMQNLRGMFAFCLYDTKKKKLFAARDRVGEKTLYFAQLPTGIVFSTELKAILKYYIPNPQLNAHALAESVRFNYPLDNRNTYIEQIKRLGAGEYAIVNADGMQLHAYWKLSHAPLFDGKKEEAKAEVLRLMRSSVADCLQSDVPVAVLLSGGIDSSAIAHFAKETGREIHVISAGYAGQHSQDERSVAKRFAAEQGLVYHEIELDASDFQSLFTEYMPYIDEPVSDVSSMSQYALYKKAKELGFKVLLCGIGGDELFFGYPGFNQVVQQLDLRRQHRALFPWHGRKKWDFLRFMTQHAGFVLFGGYPYVLDDRWPVDWTYQDYKRFATDAQLEWGGEVIRFADIDVHYAYPTEADLDTVYDLEFTTFMKNLCLYLSDRLGMANSLEIRSPLLDYRIVDFVSHLPQEMKYDGTPKGFYKWCLRGIVPDYILDARKRGFEPPWDFIREMNKEYQYKHIQASHCFFNSMLADKVLDNMLYK